MFKVGDFVVRKSDYKTMDYSRYADKTKAAVISELYQTDRMWFRKQGDSIWIPCDCYTLSFKNYKKLCEKD